MNKTYGMPIAQDVINNRETEHIIFVRFTYFYGEWIETVLYDSRKTPYDIPYSMMYLPVESINIVDGLTIAEMY